MKNITSFIVFIVIHSLVHAAALEFAAPAQNIININIIQKKQKTIINYQLNDHTFSFNSKILATSNTIKNLQEDCHEPVEQQITHLTKILFDDLNHKQIALLIKALERNTADIHDASQPSLEAIRFVQKRNAKKLCWLADQALFWDIRHIYHAAVNQLAEIIQYEDTPTLRQLHKDISYDIAKQIDYSDLKLVAGARLQHNIAPHKHTMSRPQAIFSSDGSRILFVYEYGNPPVYIYDVPAQKIIGDLTPPAYKEVGDACYAHNDTRIIVKTLQEYPLGSLFVYDSQSLELIKSIPLARYFEAYALHNEHIATYDKHQVTIYTDQNISHISEPNTNINTIWYSPDGSQLCIRRGSYPAYKLYFHNMPDKQLITVIDYQDWIYPIYSSNGPNIFVITDNRILLYKAHDLTKEPREIVHIPQQESLKIERATLSPDNTQLAILTSKRLLLYDIKTNTLKLTHLPYNIAYYNNYQIHYSSDSSQLLLGTTDHSMLEWRKDDGIFTCNTKEDTIQLKHLLHPDTIRFFNYYYPDCSKMLCRSAPDEDLYVYDIKTGKHAFYEPLAKHCVKVSYSPDKAHMALSTPRDGFTIRPTLKSIFLNHDIRHLQLMFKAFNNWHHYKQPYAIITKKEKEVYDSLDPLLQDERLFTVHME